MYDYKVFFKDRFGKVHEVERLFKGIDAAELFVSLAPTSVECWHEEVVDPETCDHPHFEDGECARCEADCEHDESSEGYCIECGQRTVQDEPDGCDLAHRERENPND